MLSVYTRHSHSCEHRTDIYYRRCRCPKWIQGVISEERGFVRLAAKTRSWEQAQDKARNLECAARPNIQARSRVSIEDAIREYRADEAARSLSKTSIGQSKTFFERQLLSWTKAENLVYLCDLTTIHLSRFRTSWNNGANTTRRKHERLISFLDFCINNDWLDDNPAARMKKVKAKRIPTDYFTKDEFDQIVESTYTYGKRRGRSDLNDRRCCLRALILLMRWSGLAIKDAVTLKRDRLDPAGKLFLYRAKTGVPVYLPLPDDVTQLLQSLPNSNPRYFFWSGNGDPETAKKSWQRTLRSLFRSAQLTKTDGTLKRCHPHMFRDTFAVALLLSGVPIDQVSLLLGHSSVKITERHYVPFVKARQEQLETSVRLSWKIQRLT